MPKWQDPLQTEVYGVAHRPPILGTHGMVSSGHYVASLAGAWILKQGGNAIDAGVASGLCLNVLQPDMTSLGGVAPMMIYRADTQEVTTIDGLGGWPRAASVEYFHTHCGGDMPPGILRSVHPAAAGAWIAALQQHGTMTFGQVAETAIEVATEGFPVYRFLHRNLIHDLAGYRRYPTTRELFLDAGDPLPVGRLLVQRDLAATLRRMVAAEDHARADGRAAGLEAARAEFYEGETADRIARFVEAEGGLLRLDDLRDYRVRTEPPVTTHYKGFDVFACGPWCQGPVLLQALNMLEGDDLASLSHNGGDYLHVIFETLKLCFADREAYYGDPAFVDVPMTQLLSKSYARARRAEIRQDQASPGMPAAGDLGRAGRVAALRGASDARPEPDTSYVAAVDRWGNAFSATPSDSASSAPLVSGVGCIVSSRGSQSWLTAGHPSALAPGKRPRLTPAPGLVLRDRRPYLVFGTPGGDLQPQAMLQVLLGVVEFGVELQTAIEMDRAHTYSFPNSFWPHGYREGAVDLEPGIQDAVAEDLKGRGHRVRRLTQWERHRTSGVCAIQVDIASKTLIGAADSRRASYAVGW
jgi:gamma-glutamyltranspeptidase / glutathione hydrolase